MALPRIIQGGMGVGVSNWVLAQAVSRLGQLGVVSGTAMDTVLVRRLQDGDPGGHMRRALSHFPVPGVAERILSRFFVADGREETKAYKSKPLLVQKPGKMLVDLLVAANFVEVFLAKDGHNGAVGINFLEKIQLPTLPSLFGAMLAGVDFVLMGAGIPKAIPEILDRLSAGQDVRLRLDVKGAESQEEFFATFDPSDYCGGTAPSLKRPNFCPIISSSTLAMTLAKKSTGRVDGFIVEGATAGGHNAPPRGGMVLGETGEPVYGERDIPDLKQIAEIGLPFWLAGSYADPEKFKQALEQGATGVQIGTAFAFCEESGIAGNIKAEVLKLSQQGKAAVFTDPLASPTGFPFKVVGVAGSVSDTTVYKARERVCDLGYLRQAYRTADGGLGYRCPAEPLEDYLRKGGKEEDTVGRKCVCNGLLSTIGLAQRHKGAVEPPLITAGDDVKEVARFLAKGRESYSAADVVSYVLHGKSGLDRAEDESEVAV